MFTQSIDYLFHKPSSPTSPTHASSPNLHITDEQGEECTVIKANLADDIFEGMDVEMGIGSSVLSRFHYPINKERLNVGGIWGDES